MMKKKKYKRKENNKMFNIKLIWQENLNFISKPDSQL